MHNLSFHIGVKLLRPKILSFTDGCWPFRHSKTVARWGRERRRRRGRIAAAGRRKSGGKRREMTRDDAREPGTKEDSSKQQCLHSPAEENTFHDPKKPGHRCIQCLPSFFSFFFSTVTRSTRPTSKRCVVVVLCEGRWFNVWRSRPGNCKHCPSPSSKFFATENRDNWYIKEANWIKNLASCPSCGYSNKRIK